MKTKNLTTEEIINQIQDASEGIYNEKGLTRYSVRIDDDNVKETIANGLKNAGLEMKHLTQLLEDGALFGYFMDDRALHIRLNNDFLLNMKTISQQPTHAKVEWKITHSEGRVLVTDMNGNLAADCGKEGNKHAEESAQRIVKAVNIMTKIEDEIKILEDNKGELSHANAFFLANLKRLLK